MCDHRRRYRAIKREVEHPARAVAVTHGADGRHAFGFERSEHFVERRARVLSSVRGKPPEDVESLHELAISVNINIVIN
jgi:hypothetical protein